MDVSNLDDDTGANTKKRRIEVRKADHTMPRERYPISSTRLRARYEAISFIVSFAVLSLFLRETSMPQGIHISGATGTFPAYCDWKAKMTSSVHTDAALKRALQLKRNIYVGAGDKHWFGWESHGKKHLDVTRRADFVSNFCPGEVQAFLSEHTFEHIPLDDTKKAFQLFFEFLTPGGHVRTAIPSFPFGHKGSAVDEEYGHVNFLTVEQLVALMEELGYVDVQALEWVDFQAGTVQTKYWNVCEGPIRRSVAFATKNQHFLSANCHILNRTQGTKAPDLNSFLSQNTFSRREVRSSSTIVQGHKPRVSSK